MVSLLKKGHIGGRSETGTWPRPPHSGLPVLTGHSGVTVPVLKCVLGKAISSTWQKPHIGHLDLHHENW